MVVFSSIHASQIDAGEDGRTKAVGAGHLKAFLEYAERGNAVAAPAPSGPSRECFGDVVAAFLAEHGYAVDRDVGCSDYRIDVAVRHPECADRYLMGIECDGPSYARQRTAQDRDVNRAEVLRGLGWNTCRVWSVDWASTAPAPSAACWTNWRPRAGNPTPPRAHPPRSRPNRTPPRPVPPPPQRGRPRPRIRRTASGNAAPPRATPTSTRPPNARASPRWSRTPSRPKAPCSRTSSAAASARSGGLPA